MHQRTQICRAALALVLTLGLSACNQTSDPTERTSGIQNLDRTQNGKARDGYLLDQAPIPMNERIPANLGEQNPNLYTGRKDVINQGVDIRNMKEMAKRVPGVEDVRIAISGGNAYLTLDLAPNITAARARQVEREVLRAVSRKVPRYDYHITSDDSFYRK